MSSSSERETILACMVSKEGKGYHKEHGQLAHKHIASVSIEVCVNVHLCRH